jgi:hypothetical protein
MTDNGSKGAFPVELDRPADDVSPPVDHMLASRFDPAISSVFLLSDYDNYGLSERVCYHFDLMGALSNPTEQSAPSVPPEENRSTDISPDTSYGRRASPLVYPAPAPVAGVVGLLECIPAIPWKTLSTRKKSGRRDRKALLDEIRRFNSQASSLPAPRSTHAYQPPFCHEPKKLPLLFSPSTRVFFTYKLTRWVNVCASE